MSTRRAGWAVAAALVLLSGCAEANEQQSILDPRGTRAEGAYSLWQLMFPLGVVVWVIVVVIMVAALVRRRRQSAPENERHTMWFVATAGAILPAVVIVVLMARSTVVLSEIDPRNVGDGQVVEVIGRQFWWEVRYPGAGVVTANEIHIPTGERVRLQVSSNDVIHSFWVPKLSGKIDMIPGTSNTLWLETNEPGTYWGQCAEYCGAQHALMRIVVVAHEPDEFAGWIAAQQQPAAFTPGAEESEQVARGRQVFLSSHCVYCHTVQGTAALGEAGPDLTHLASRQTLASGILPNNRGNLAGWIADPQSIKPGNRMPGTDIAGDDMQALLDYLESLE